jgi:hypothetical protein
MTFDRRRSELEARSLRRLDLPRVYHENQIAELDAHNSIAIARSRISVFVIPAKEEHSPCRCIRERHTTAIGARL